MRVAENARASVASVRFAMGEGQWYGSVSIGVSACQAAATTSRELMKAADDGVHLAERASRSCVRTAGGTPSS